MVLSIGQNFLCKNFFLVKFFFVKNIFSSQKITRFFFRGLQTLLIFLMSHKQRINVYKIVNSYDRLAFYAVVAQLVRALVCGTRGRRFKSHQPYQERRHFHFCTNRGEVCHQPPRILLGMGILLWMLALNSYSVQVFV